MADEIQIIDNRFTEVDLGSDVPDQTDITIEIAHDNNTIIYGNLFRRNHGVATKSDDYSA